MKTKRFFSLLPLCCSLIACVFLGVSCTAQTVVTNWTTPYTTNAPSLAIWLFSQKFDTDARSFIYRAGIGNYAEQVAVNQLVTDLKTNNLWTNLVAFYPFLGETAASCSQNLMGTNYTITWCGTNNTPFTNSAQFDPSNLVFSASGVADVTNATFSGPSLAWGNTGFSPSTWTATNSFHLFAWVTSSITNYGGIWGEYMGNFTNSATLAAYPSSPGENQSYIISQGSVFSGDYAIANGAAEFIGGPQLVQRVATNSVQMASSTDAGPLTIKSLQTGFPLQSTNANNICLLRVPGSPYGTGGQFRAASFGYSLSASQVTNYFAIVNRFQAILNRQTP